MALIAVAADKGAPGVTTASVALAAVWPRPVLLAECDPAGGDVVYRLPAADGGRLDPRRGLLSLAVAARRGLLPEQVWEHTQKLRGGLDVLVGTANAEQGAGLDPLWGQVGGALAGVPQADVIADCGRIGPEGRLYDLLARADAVVLITRASLGDMVRLRDRATIVEAALRRRAGTASRIGVVVIADYKHFATALAEVRQVLDRAESPVSVLGGFAFEPKSAELLSGEWGGKLDKSLLIRTAREIAATLAANLPAPQYRETAAPAVLPAPALPAPALAGGAAPGPAAGAAQPGLQSRRGRRGSTGPVVPARPAAAAYSGSPPAPPAPAAPAARPAGPAPPAMPAQPLPPARDWAQLAPAAAAPSGPGAAATLPAASPPATARFAPAPSHDTAPQHRLPPGPLPREPQPRDGGWPAADPPPAEPSLAALPPLPPTDPGGGSPQPEPHAVARQDGSSPVSPAGLPPARPLPLRQVPGDQTYGAAVLPPPAGGGREPADGAASQPEPGPGLLGPAYDSPGWQRSHPSAAPGEPGLPPAGADPAAVHPGHQPAVLRGSVLPPVPHAGYPERSAHQRPGRQEQSDWWTAPDPWAPAERGSQDRPARGHPASEHGTRDYGSYEPSSHEPGSDEDGAVSGSRGRHAGSRDDAQAPAAEPGGR